MFKKQISIEFSSELIHNSVNDLLKKKIKRGQALCQFFQTNKNSRIDKNLSFV